MSSDEYMDDNYDYDYGDDDYGQDDEKPRNEQVGKLPHFVDFSFSFADFLCGFLKTDS